MQKSKIKAIYTLNFMQQALLLHSLQSTEDQGAILVQCHLKGNVDPLLFQTAWNEVAKRHEVLRSSVHWEKIEKPVQVVHPSIELSVEIENFSMYNSEEKNNLLKNLKNSLSKEKINLNKPPAGKLVLVQFTDDEFILLWKCHHLLIDGWSTGIVLRDFFAYYATAVQGDQPLILDTLPTYKHYLSWLKTQNLSEAERFWKSALNEFHTPTLIGNSAKGQNNIYLTQELTFTPAEHQNLKQIASAHKVTLNTFIQGIWGILLGYIFNREDVVFGTTVSGRAATFPQAELIAGMFMNVLPVRMKINQAMQFGDWLKTLQAYQSSMLNQEYISLDQIFSWNNQSAYASLFDTLVIFENFPLEGLEGGGLRLTQFESGLTSNYPLTLAVRPHEVLDFQLKYNTSLIEDSVIQWLKTQFEVILRALIDLKVNTIQDIQAHIDSNRPAIVQQDMIINNAKQDVEEKAYVGPRNEIELKLTAIWEKLFEKRPISVLDNFFEIGGKSLLAVSLFAEIKAQLHKNLPPITILDHPTIAAIAKIIQEDREDKPWSALVPLRSSGSKTPIYCLHGGGSHVFFYNGLAKHLGTDQPVYALQSINTDSGQKPHESIEEMAAHYLEEIFKLQPKGPYALLGYCFSNAICLEMAERIRKKGEEVALLAIVDSGPSYYIPRSNQDKISRLGRLLKKGNIYEVIKKIEWKLIRPVLGSYSPLAPKGWKPDYKMPTSLSAKIARKYQWKPYDGKITLIRSSAFNENPEKEDTVKAWTSLANGGLDVYVIPGKHKTIFMEPDVQGLASQLAACLEHSNQ